MRYLHSYFQILKLPFVILLFACFLGGISNLIVNNSYGIVSVVTGDGIYIVGEAMGMISRAVINYVPLLMLIRLTTQREKGSVMVGAGLLGYITFLAATIFVPSAPLPAYAYSAMFSLGSTTSSISYLAGAAHYPLLSGMVGIIIVTALTYAGCNSLDKNKNQMITQASMTHAVLKTFVYCLIAGVAFGFVWPYFILFVVRLVNYISSDLSSPLNMVLYGIADRFLQTFHLSALIRQPLWYTAAGGSWTNIAGTTILGDANIWTAQVASNALTTSTGRFFAPYYVMNIFAMPAMIWAMYGVGTSPKQRGKMRVLCIMATLISFISGTTYPLQIMLLLVCPVLFLFHMIYNGFLYGLFATINVNLGYQTVDVHTMSAMPGTLPEFISYMNNPTLYRNLIIIAVIGIVSAVVYYIVTRLYFHYGASDLIMHDEAKKDAMLIIKGVGGQENIKNVEADITSLYITVYDKNTVNEVVLKDIGTIQIQKQDNTYGLYYGAKSYILRKNIKNSIRE
ncbi:MAG: PTS transporter subunit EIIB [Bulleidia sp.]|nr:PTS transporter subunit EIIB [Bulleidia sp.]